MYQLFPYVGDRRIKRFGVLPEAKEEITCISINKLIVGDLALQRCTSAAERKLLREQLNKPVWDAATVEATWGTLFKLDVIGNRKRGWGFDWVVATNGVAASVAMYKSTPKKVRVHCIDCNGVRKFLSQDIHVMLAGTISRLRICKELIVWLTQAPNFAMH
jgi:hypothetical protein